jgi:hypothetical protein
MNQNKSIIPEQMNIDINDVRTKLNKYKEEQSKYEDCFKIISKTYVFR